MVRDPVRGTYYKFNPLQAAMLRKLDGIRTLDEMVEVLSDEFEVEIPRQSAERFVAQARKMFLLDIASYNVSEHAAQQQVLKALKKAGFKFRGMAGDPGPASRVVSAEAVLFMGGLRHLQAGHPAKALDYFSAVLELNPKNQRAKTLVDTIQNAYIKALSGATTDFPTFATFNPTRILKVLDPWLGKFLFHRLAPLWLIGIVLFAAYSWANTSYEDVEIGAFDIVLAYVFALCHMFLHEMGHGLACYHFGGKVPEVGFTVFYYLMPFPYCDTSSTYLFQSRTHKIIVQMAGNLVSLLVLCLLVILLSVLQSDVAFYGALYINMYIAVAALAGNLIPFMKLDGYYTLCEILAIPNLRERSFKLLKSRVGGWLFGVYGAEEDIEPRKRRLFFWFALLSFFWTVNWLYQAVFKITAPVVERFQGTGLVLSVVILGYLLRRALFRPVKNLIMFLVRERKQIFTLRRSVTMLALLAAVIAPWTIQWPVLVDADFVLVPKERREVRAEVGGVVDQILVHEGELVHRGQPLATLYNPELVLQVQVAEAEVAAADARLLQLRNGASPEEIQLARRQLQTAIATTHKESRDASVAARLAKAGVGARADAETSAGSAAVSRSLASAAQWKLATLQAGSREEAIAAAEAERASLVAELERARQQRELLTIRSPLDGIVTTKYLEDRRLSRLERGATFAEIQDISSFVAEIRIPESAPLGELEVGDEVALRLEGLPGHDIECRIERIRDVAETKQDTKDETKSTRELVFVTSAFQIADARSGMGGHARIYGHPRSLAYAKLYLPLQRVVRVSLWALM
ncbi:MAG TPA: PqqD family peptide modification chaperone [Kofleriaceae bacterium]|nr:PqqD family peptide modification chaperone [Kofleriaceae bacterium]